MQTPSRQAPSAETKNRPANPLAWTSSSGICWRRLLEFAALQCLALGAAAAHADCGDPLFVCETTRPDTYIEICATEIEVGRRWTDLQYRYGPEGAPELVYPADASRGASQMFFSHEKNKHGDYTVAVRFNTGPYVYRVYSSTGRAGAGVTVSDKTGKLLSNVRCAERPTIFPSYLQRALACDMTNPHGRAACGDRPYVSK